MSHHGSPVTVIPLRGARELYKDTSEKLFMEKSNFDLYVGMLLMGMFFILLVLPAFLPIDAFITFMLSVVSFIFGIVFFLMGHEQK